MMSSVSCTTIELFTSNEMLSKLDRMTMLCSVEGRAPFAAKSIQNLSSRLRYSDLVTSHQLKAILKRIIS